MRFICQHCYTKTSFKHLVTLHTTKTLLVALFEKVLTCLYLTVNTVTCGETLLHIFSLLINNLLLSNKKS